MQQSIPFSSLAANIGAKSKQTSPKETAIVSKERSIFSNFPMYENQV